jgi:hypothetical protein
MVKAVQFGSQAAPSMTRTMSSIVRERRRLLPRPGPAALLFAVAAFQLALVCSRAEAAEIYESDGLNIRWDNTLRYTASFRLNPYSEDLVANPNADDGDRNFAPGLISNRFDFLSELDIARGDFGIHASGDGWYDTVYHQHNANDSPSTFNPVSVPHNAFPRAVQTLDGKDAELLDAFFYGGFDAGGIPITFRVGRHTLLWGESLFFAENGIAAGQAPIDEIKALSEPDAEAKEVFLPVGQASLSVQALSNLALSFYYQFEWRRTRLPGVGSYFSDADILDAGGERVIIQPGEYLYRGHDQTPSSSGQYGAAVHLTLGEVDYGLYALRYNSKDPEVLLEPGIAAGPGGAVTVTNPNIVNLSVGRVGNYTLLWPSGIEVYGASFSFYAGNAAIAGEVSARRNMPLVSSLSAIPGAAGGGDYGGGGYGGGAYGRRAAYADHQVDPSLIAVSPQLEFPRGDTLHAQVSGVMTFPRSGLWDSADLSAEVAMNDVLDVTNAAYALDPTRDRFAAAIRGLFTPEYFQVLPGLDLSFPVSLGIGIIGRSSTDPSQNAGSGDLEAGVGFTYRTVWNAAITFTHFVGNAQGQSFADRDFVSLNLQRTL